MNDLLNALKCHPYIIRAVTIAVYLLSVALIITQGSTGPGLFYLLCASIFTGTLFYHKQIYFSCLVLVITLLGFTLIIAYRLIETPLLHQFTALSWLRFTINLLIINIAVLSGISIIIKKPEENMTKEDELTILLAKEIKEKTDLYQKIRESENYYRYLFASNPVPMWVFDMNTLKFLQVNDAAVNLYGYSREEFLNLTIMDIRPESEVEHILNMVADKYYPVTDFKGNMKHLKKNKKVFPVEIRSNPIQINGKTARLVMATDITDRTNYIRNIEEQNKRLHDIAWIQSHKVRAPLARVISLVDLLSRPAANLEQGEILRYLSISAGELNQIVTSLIKQAEEDSR